MPSEAEQKVHRLEHPKVIVCEDKKYRWLCPNCGHNQVIHTTMKLADPVQHLPDDASCEECDTCYDVVKLAGE